MTASTRTMNDLAFDVLPRLVGVKSGITIYDAANSITSLIYHKLLDRNSDLIATGIYEAILPAHMVPLPLPDYFSSFSERPKLFKGDSIIAGLLAALETAGVQPATMATITAMLASGTLVADIQALAQVDVPTIDVSAMVRSLVNRHHHLEPSFLDDDIDRDHSWYSWYASESSFYSGCERRYKVINDTVYVRPRQEEDCLMSARYFQLPAAVSLPTDILQYSSLSYQVYKEGVVMIIAKGLAIPEADPAFNALFDREVTSVVNARSRILPRRRMTGRNWI